VIQRDVDRMLLPLGPLPRALAEGAWNRCGSWPAHIVRAGRSSSSAGTAIAATATAARPAPVPHVARACSPPASGTSPASRVGTPTPIGSGDIESVPDRK
jgi:hypothetical protein